MRVILAIAFTCGITQATFAHTLASGQGFVDSLGHQLFSVHHFPVTLLFAGAGWLTVRTLRKLSKKSSSPD